MRRKKLRHRQAVVKDEWKMRPKIINSLRAGPKTIPELTRELNVPSDELVYWLMSMRQYGLIEEVQGSNVEGYYSYQLNR